MQSKALQPNHLNKELSPYSGLTRKSWLDAGIFLLTGIFKNIPSFDAPVLVPRHETDITYPNKDSAPHKTQAEYFEGLARSFFIAAPLLKNIPELTICGYSMKEYYKTHILRACTKGDPLWVYHLSDMKQMEPENLYGNFQQTVEMAALVICLWVSRDVIWDSYTSEEKDRITEFISDYAHGSTIPHNWRMFNMLGLAFLHMEGYPVDKDIMRDHAKAILNWYVGEGWYRDGHSFDYYSCWAFQLYAPLWNLWYGYKEEPYLAKCFEDNSNTLMMSYPAFFDADGFTNLWGRSNIYRNAATSALFANFFLANPSADPGLARRICSGSLLQFLTREDLWYQGVPVLGFYRPFLPMVQSYSCAESPFWLAKSFLCLALTEDHIFWKATENNGIWEVLGKEQNQITTLNGPALSYINHRANGSTELRTGKVLKAPQNKNGILNYAKLSYHSKFPWEANPCDFVASQGYILHNQKTEEYFEGNAIFWVGVKDDVLYRRNYLGFHSAKEMLWTPYIDLAEIAMPYGILRVDRMNFFQTPLSLTLGSYGFPDNASQIIHKTRGNAKATILIGRNAIGGEIQLAFTTYGGWETQEHLSSTGTNPDSEKSILVYASLKREKQYAYTPYILLSQTITKQSHEPFSEEEIFPIKEIKYTDKENCGGYGPVILTFHNGESKVIDYSHIEGNLQL